jgi:hypothetical protein
MVYQDAYYSSPRLPNYSLIVGTHHIIITLRFLPVFTLLGTALVLVVFATILARWQPKGPQPATYSYIQTLADLIDDWYVGKDEKLW